MDDVRRQLHNEAVMQEMKRIEDEVKSAVDPVTQSMSISDHSAPESTPDSEPAPSAPRPTSEAELEAQHASKLKQAAADAKDDRLINKTDDKSA